VMATIRIGTRASKLAIAQAEIIRDLLKKHHPNLDIELIKISTSGDQDRSTPLHQLGGQGVFTKRIESELLNSTIDIAVHSAKDLPSRMTEGLSIGAVPSREIPFDVLISYDKNSLADLKPQSLIGTGSPRRKAMLLYQRPDLKVNEIRGNVETRLNKLANGEYDALIMAYAGLNRLGLTEFISQILPIEIFPPAPGQGAIVAQCRAGDDNIIKLLKLINDADAFRCLNCERLLQAGLDAGCSAAVGGYANIQANILTMRVSVLDKAGNKRLDITGESSSPANDRAMVKSLVDDLISRGAKDLIE
jgi:hydroxymethylbilane synthase